MQNDWQPYRTQSASNRPRKRRAPRVMRGALGVVLAKVLRCPAKPA